jgi:hypothetical protein
VTQPFNLMEHCMKQVEQFGDDAHVLLKIRGRWGKRTSARLLGRHGGPSGYIVSELDDQHILVDFKAWDVLKVMSKGMVAVS